MESIYRWLLYADAEKSLLEAFGKRPMIEELSRSSGMPTRRASATGGCRVKFVIAVAAIVDLVEVNFSTMIFSVGEIFFLFSAFSGNAPCSPVSTQTCLCHRYVWVSSSFSRFS
jgi:hypothetical protein